VATTPANRIGPDDARYRAVVDRQFNKRFRAMPDYVRIVSSTAEVVAAVNDAVHEGRRLVVTSGGHCLEAFVSAPDVKVIVDISPMKRVAFDADRRAIVVESGATVGETFKVLANEWETVIPLGEYPGVGIGGHVLGGAFGFLCRQLGLAADYLYGVEVVTVDTDREARDVVATRDDTEALHELWWAHTGGGGGNFGIVTRYWFRTEGALGNDAAKLLPRAPESIATLRAEWSWDDFEGEGFARLMRNHGTWSEAHAAADSPFSSLWTLLEVHRQGVGGIGLRGVSTAGDGASNQFDQVVARLSDGGAAPRRRDESRMSWLDFALDPLPDLFGGAPPGGVRTKVKDAVLRRALTDAQIEIVHRYVARDERNVPGAMFGLASYGGCVNTRATDATAAPQRRGILDIACSAGWIGSADDAVHLSWAREFYRDLFAETGGVPLPGDAYDGALINHPDTDLADARWNTSGVPWSAIYYQGNYARLQRVKARWDPHDIFNHALSVRPG
jgi:aclacinomycin oxidase